MPGGDVFRLQFTLDSRRVLYIADQDTDDVVELYGSLVTGPFRPR